MDDIERLTNLAKAKLEAAKAKAKEFEGKDIPKEEAEAIQAMMGEYDTIKAQLDLLQRVSAGDEFLHEPTGVKAAHLGWRESAPGEGDVPVDGKSWHEVDVVDALGRTSKVRFHVPIAVQAKGYKDAMEAYIRFGSNRVATKYPNDFKLLQEAVDSAGGHLAPPDYHAELIKKMATFATIRPNARVIQTSRDVAQWPSVEYSSDNNYSSGVRLTWSGEAPASATTIRVTEPVFGLKSIPIHTAMASMPLSNDMLEDSAFDVWGIGAELFAEAFALGEENSFINGDGVAQPLGLLGLTPGTTDALPVQTPTTAGTLGWVDLINAYWAVPAQYRATPRVGWWFESATAAIIDKIVDGNGRPILQSLMSGSLAAPQIDVIKGKPVHYAELFPSHASGAYYGVFGDMSGYFVVDRVGLSLARYTDSKYAELNSSLLLGRKRVGGMPVETWKLKALKG